MSSASMPDVTLEDLFGEYVFNLDPDDVGSKSDLKLGLEDVAGSVSKLGLEDVAGSVSKLGLEDVAGSVSELDLGPISKLGLENVADNFIVGTRPKGPLKVTFFESLFSKCVNTALARMNEKQAESNGMKYKLVQLVDYLPFQFDEIYHCNFIAGPENENGEAENVLVFAEVKSHKKKLRPVRRNGKKLRRRRFEFTCPFYRILGPSDLEAPEMEQMYGCNSCDRLPGRVQHPENGFTVIDDGEYESDSDDYVNVTIPKKRVPYPGIWADSQLLA